MSHIYCPECGFQNPEAANYCAKCGALLHTQESVETTQTFSPEEGAEVLDALGDIGVQGPALIVRSGGGRSGETFAPKRLARSAATASRSAGMPFAAV